MRGKIGKDSKSFLKGFASFLKIYSLFAWRETLSHIRWYQMILCKNKSSNVIFNKIYCSSHKLSHSNVKILMYSLAQNPTVVIYLFFLYRLVLITLNTCSSFWITHVKSKKSLYWVSIQTSTHRDKTPQQTKKPYTPGLSLLYNLLWNKKIKFSLLSQPRLSIQLIKCKNKLMFIWSSKELFKLPF